MASYPYFVLTTSNSSLSKKFRVILGGRKRTIKKAQSVDNTVDGELDVSVGSLREYHQYLVKVRENEPESGYGSLHDLQTFFELTNPNATPSMVITLTDHFGNNHECLMLGDFSENLLGIMIEGDTAWSTVETSFILK